MVSNITRWKLAVHGPLIELDSTVSELDGSIQALLGEFATEYRPGNFDPGVGKISPYSEVDVMRRLPASARHVTRTPDGMDVFADAERLWLIDDRWGMSEIDLASNCWQSWILPQPRLDVLRVTESAVVVPMAQVLRNQGLHLLPAISAVRDGFAILLICPFGVEAELSALCASGYKLIGQRWTALREEEGRLALLHMPGRVERFTTPRLRFNVDEDQTWFDLTQDRPGTWQNHAFCDAIIVAEPGRRAKAHLREHDTASGINLLRRDWPILQLHSARQPNSLPARIVESCRCYELQLSRNPKDLLALLHSMRYGNPLTHEQAAAA